ncbi:MAG: NAD(+)/NADH kinase [Oscillospiraceae bacterium]|nr:NAD(+)/NADH kinase [Oscillospiraceae bacterium]
MMKIALLPNLGKKDAKLHTGTIIRTLHDCGAQVLLHLPMEPYFGKLPVQFYDDFDQMIGDCDVLLAVGGDGTIIHAAKHGALVDKPILGINLGRMGFVAGLEKDELNFLDNLVRGDYKIDERMMLEVTYPEEGRSITKHVVNEAVLSRGALSKIVDFTVSSGGSIIGEYRADGLIVATPTGSTAYSLSAGGPVIDPAMDCILLTPVCPHSLFSRTVVFGSKTALTIEGCSQYNSDVFLTLDGEDSVQIFEGEQVTFRRSDRRIRMIKLKQNSFLEVVKEKIGK